MMAFLAGWELRRKEPLIELRHFRNRSFTAAVLIAVCAFADLGGFLFLTTIYLQDVRGSSPVHAALHLLPTAAAMAVCPSLATWMTAKTGSAKLPLIIGGLALMLSTNLMTQLTGSAADIRLVTTFGLFGLGMGMVNSQISVAAVAGMPAYQAGLASGIAFVVVVSGLMPTRARARHAMAGNAGRRPQQLPEKQVPYSPPQPLPQRVPQRSLPPADPGFLAAPPGDPAGG